MSKNEILNQLKVLKEPLEKDGFIIDGIFGSYARNENIKKIIQR